MPAVWLVSDTHFGHAGVCRFLREDGTKLRPWDDPAEMDELWSKLGTSVSNPTIKCITWAIASLTVKRCLRLLD